MQDDHKSQIKIETKQRAKQKEVRNDRETQSQTRAKDCFFEYDTTGFFTATRSGTYDKDVSKRFLTKATKAKRKTNNNKKKKRTGFPERKL